jgi:hypothetical protein
MTTLSDLYEQDFYAWALESAQALRERRFADIDSEHIAEELEELLEENPSLKPRLPELLGRAYLKGVKRAVVETDLPEDTFPPQCPWDLQRVLDAQFLPD